MAVSKPNPEVPEPDLSGRTLGDYRILRRLGRGGMAVVYLAEQQSLQRQVAFKVLRASLASDENAVRRFHNEARSAAALVHAHIVQIYEVGCEASVHFIAQEYVPGQNLAQLLQRGGPLDAAAGVRILRQVAAALHKAAQEDIVHRDIKPENILLTREGLVKVVDFGLARVIGGDDKDLTEDGMTVGTPVYMSPEQISGSPLDCRSDLYSLGVTGYQMYAGEPPFVGDVPLNVAALHLHREPDRLELRRADLPSGLCRAVHKMLAKKPEQRFRTPAELVQQLRELDIEGLEDDWPEEMFATDLLLESDSRRQMTQTLETVMKAEARPPWGRYAAGFAVLVVAAFLSGAGFARLTAPPSLLAIDARELPRVERMPDVREQFYFAKAVNSEPAWQVIGQYFPPEDSEVNRYYSRQAKRHLAQLYLEQDKEAEAQALYEELASLPPSEVEFRAAGLAGQAQLFARRQQVAELRSCTVQLRLLLPRLDPAARSELLRTLPTDVRNQFGTSPNPRRTSPP